MLRVEVTEKRGISGSDEVRRHVVGGVRAEVSSRKGAGGREKPQELRA